MSDGTDALAELRAKHGTLIEAETPAGLLAFRKPSRAEFEKFQDGITDGEGSKAQALRKFALSCCVHPDQVACSAVFDEYPMLPTKLVDSLQELAGGGIEISISKS